MEEFIKIAVSVSGTRPLLQNPFLGLEESDDKVVKKGIVYNDEDECQKRLIKDVEGNLCQPARHFEASMVKSATEFKFKGHKTYKDLFKAGVFVDPLLIPHKNDKWVIDKCAVKIGQARVPRCRPRLDKWSLDFQIEVRDDRIEPLVVEQVLVNSGKYHGIGDDRPRHGLFKVDKFEIVKYGDGKRKLKR